jgi:hypothetical protein
MNLDNIVRWLLITAIVILVASIIFWLIPKEIARSDRARDIAKQQGCEYIGSARDLPQVKFMDCSGEIKMVKVK